MDLCLLLLCDKGSGQAEETDTNWLWKNQFIVNDKYVITQKFPLLSSHIFSVEKNDFQQGEGY